MVNKKETVANANSSGLIKDFYSKSSALNRTLGRKADFNVNTALKIIKNDPVIKGAMITMTDRVMETPWQIVGVDKRSKKVTLERQLEDLRFNTLLRKVIMNMVLYGNAFVEVVKKKGKVTDLNILETTHMEILSKDNGDITGYQQVVGGVKGSPILWNPEQVVHFKLTEITTNVWGEVDIESIYDTVLIKDGVRNWIRWFFQTNQSRGFYNIKSANSTKVKDFLSHLKASEQDLTKPIIAQGEVTFQILRSFAEEGKSMQDVMLWCDTQMLALLQVPPIAIGFPDQSGRSNSVEQNAALSTRIKSVHNILEDTITYELFPRMGNNKVYFEFGTLDNKSMKSIMETVKIMRDAGMTDEAVTEWLITENIIFKTNEIFKEPEPMGMPGGEKDTKGVDEPNKELDTISTRDDQLVKNSEDDEDEQEQWEKY
jgi:hypothetical protein